MAGHSYISQSSGGAAPFQLKVDSSHQQFYALVGVRIRRFVVQHPQVQFKLRDELFEGRLGWLFQDVLTLHLSVRLTISASKEPGLSWLWYLSHSSSSFVAAIYFRNCWKLFIIIPWLAWLNKTLQSSIKLSRTFYARQRTSGPSKTFCCEWPSTKKGRRWKLSRFSVSNANLDKSVTYS
jgi:hypothetical protein